MLTDREQKLVNWPRTRKVATMRHLRHQFQVCHMTVFRALKKYGYHTSYNHNAAYYTLTGVPQFDDWGLWAYRDVSFSRAGTLLETLVALVTQATGGLTVGELEERLQTPVANLLSRLVQQGRLHHLLLRNVHERQNSAFNHVLHGPVGHDPHLVPSRVIEWSRAGIPRAPQVQAASVDVPR